MIFYLPEAGHYRAVVVSLRFTFLTYGAFIKMDILLYIPAFSSKAPFQRGLEGLTNEILSQPYKTLSLPSRLR
jgi:hypothetical protein